MKALWRWIQNNSPALQGLAAIVVIITAMIGAWAYMSHVMRPDIVMHIDVDKNTIPPDLAEFNNRFSELSMFKDDIKIKNGYKSEEETLNKILNDPLLKKIRRVIALDKAKIEITNQSDRVVSGVHIRINNINYLWGYHVAGTYIQEGVSNKFKADIGGVETKQAIIFPELPPIPPNSSITITLYGEVYNLKPIMTAAGYSYETKHIIKIQDSAFIFLYRNPGLMLSFLPMVLWVLFIVVSYVWVKTRRRVIENSKKYIFYNRACRLAKDGCGDDAIVLLKQAIESGYSNKRQALNDEDLRSIRERPDFLELFDGGD